RECVARPRGGGLWFFVWSAAIHRRFCFVFCAAKSGKPNESAAEAGALQTTVWSAAFVAAFVSLFSSLRTASDKVRPEPRRGKGKTEKQKNKSGDESPHSKGKTPPHSGGILFQQKNTTQRRGDI